MIERVAVAAIGSITALLVAVAGVQAVHAITSAAQAWAKMIEHAM